MTFNSQPEDYQPPVPDPDPAAASAEPVNYTGYEQLPCQCRTSPEYAGVGALLGLCHHAEHEAVADLNRRLLLLLADQPVQFTMQEYLNLSPLQLRDRYIQSIMERNYNLRTSQEHSILAYAALRQNALGLMSVAAGYLLSLPQNQGPLGIAEPDAIDTAAQAAAAGFPEPDYPAESNPAQAESERQPAAAD